MDDRIIQIKTQVMITLIGICSILLAICAISSKQENKNAFYPVIEAIELEESESLERLNDVDYPSQNRNLVNIKEEYVDALNLFSVEVAEEVFDRNQNEVFSPISLYMALAMVLEGTTDSLAEYELTNLLKLELDDIRIALNKLYRNNYYSNVFGRAYMANSVWISKNIEVKENYTKELRNNYYTEAYRVDFTSETTKENIVKWINHYTEDLLKLNLSNYQIDNSLAMLLINTIYFNNKWQVEFDKEATQKALFTLNNKETVSADFMTHQIETKYKITEDYTLVIDNFENGNTITYLMPNDELFYYRSNLLNNIKEGTVNLSIPKIKLTKNYDLKDSLRTLGINEIFDKDNCLKNISDSLFIEYVKQDVGIEFSESGVEAAAVTSVGAFKTSIPEEVTIVLNKPFYYCIKDPSGVILFIGIVNNPNLNN